MIFPNLYSYVMVTKSFPPPTFAIGWQKREGLVLLPNWSHCHKTRSPWESWSVSNQ